MKKLADFIVNKNILILAVFIILAIISGCLISHVNINYEMVNYLPDDSETKMGVEIMNDNFEETNTLSLMFYNLTDDEKTDIYDELCSIENVESVTYDADSEDYNTDGYSLYTINISGSGYSSDSEKVLETVKEMYYDNDDYESYVSGTVVDNAAMNDGLSKLIILAMVILLIILFIMSTSWLEPFMFLITIGIAIIINMGTNVILSSVSSTTFSIAAILQLVLSMDYSIMLIDRFRQERAMGNSKRVGMSNAISKGFLSIASSSVTTIVGLLCLVFMSFTVGQDMGIVLAKGVLISLICILFVLPSLIILFDGLLAKAEKKTPNLKLKAMAKFSFKFRPLVLVLFLVFLVGGLFLRNYLNIEFLSPSNNDDEAVIEEYFPSYNSIVLLYDNDDEENVSDIIDYIDDQDGVESVTAYDNTLNTKMTSSELADSLDMDSFLTDLIFYYHDGGETGSITLKQFYKFINKYVADNDLFTDYISEDTLSQLDSLSPYMDKDTLTTAMTYQDLADTMDMDSSTIKQLYLYYFSLYGGVDTGTMTLQDFLDFLINDLSSDSQFSSYFDDDTLASLTQTQSLIDLAVSDEELDSSELADATGMDQDLIDQLFEYISAVNGTTVTEMTLPDFIDLIINDISTDENFSSYFDETTLASLNSLDTLINLAVSGTELSSSDMADTLGMDSSELDSMYLYYVYLYGDTSSWKISLQTFVDFLVDKVMTNSEYSSYFDDDTTSQLPFLQSVIDSVVNGTKYTADEMTDFISSITDEFDSDSMDLMYLYYFSIQNGDTDETMSLYNFMTYLVDDITTDSLFESYFDDDTIADLDDAMDELDDAKDSLVGDEYSRIIIETDYDDESSDAYTFIENLQDTIDDTFSSDSYILGDSAMAHEMSLTFQDEFNFISILTAVVIFIVVLITFRNFMVPTILVLLIESAIFITMGMSYFQGVAMNFLALMIVQALLMGATIDYAILFTHYYQHERMSKNIKDALAASYAGSAMTIFTSSSILIIITFIVAMTMSDPTISSVCMTISKGGLVSVILVIVILPGLLAIFDKLVCRKKKNKDEIDTLK